jgi:hypothetical protein
MRIYYARLPSHGFPIPRVTLRADTTKVLKHHRIILACDLTKNCAILFHRQEEEEYSYHHPNCAILFIDKKINKKKNGLRRSKTR